MASEVRRWILEMGAKRGGNGAGAAGVGTGTGEKDGRNYLLTARVERVRKIERGRGSCSGRVAFVESAPLDAGEDGQVRNVLLFGTPKTKHIPASVPGEEALKPGVLIGVHKGLAWEIELDRLEGPGKEKWLVCMEWDLLDSTST